MDYKNMLTKEELREYVGGIHLGRTVIEEGVHDNKTSLEIVRILNEYLNGMQYAKEMLVNSYCNGETPQRTMEIIDAEINTLDAKIERMVEI